MELWTDNDMGTSAAKPYENMALVREAVERVCACVRVCGACPLRIGPYVVLMTVWSCGLQ